MRFTSTRDHTVDCSFAEALLAGYAPDGGLFVPRHWPPPLTAMDLRNWQTLSYAQLMQRVVRRFVCPTEVTDAELRAVCEAAMEGFDVGGGDPHHKQAVPIVPLTPTPSSSCNTDHHQHQQQQQQQQQRQQQQLPNFYVAELFHGPTFCFKDLGMRAVIQLLHLLAVQQQQRSVTILVSTMGDTGPAAVQAVADLSNNNIIRNSNTPNSLSPPSPQLRIAVHFPHGQISDFQRRQMTTVAVVAPSVVRVAAFDGGGDDMDEPIKRMLSASSSQPTTTISTIEPNTTDDDLSSSSLWTGVNSYNIVRSIGFTVLKGLLYIYYIVC